VSNAFFDAARSASTSAFVASLLTCTAICALPSPFAVNPNSSRAPLCQEPRRYLSVVREDGVNAPAGNHGLRLAGLAVSSYSPWRLVATVFDINTEKPVGVS